MPTWSNHRVTGDISWPQKKAAFKFGNFEIVALPSSKTTEASLHMDLERNRVDDIRAMSILNSVLSMATWIEDAAAVLEDGWSGNRGVEPPAISRQGSSHLSSIVDFWVFQREPAKDERIEKALAIYREARNLERYHSIPYAALGYYKLLEVKFGNGLKRKSWLELTIRQLLGDSRFRVDIDLPGFEKEIGSSPESIATFLHEQGRNAVAHAHFSDSINPDDIAQIRTLSLALRAMRPIARYFIQQELGFSDHRWGDKPYEDT